MTKSIWMVVMMAVLLIVLSVGAFMDNIEAAKEGVVMMVGGEEMDDAVATGFVVGCKDGACYVVTSMAINEDRMGRVFLWRTGTETYNAVQVLDLSDYGVSVYKVLGEPSGLKPLIINMEENVEPKDELTAIGYTGGSFLSEQESASQIQSPEKWAVEVKDVELTDGVRIYEYKRKLDIRAQGGPVLDESGRVVGVNIYIESGERDYAAVDISHIVPYLTSADIPVDTGMPYSARSLIWLIGGVTVVILLLVIILIVVRHTRYVIIGLSGIHARSVINLNREEHVLMGRDPEQCSVVYPVNQRGISRIHCEVYYDREKKQYMIQDMSSEGTFIYGRKMTEGRPLELKEGAKFYLADAQQMFEFKKK